MRVFCVDSVDVYHRDGCKENFGCGLREATVLAVPAGTIQKQTIHVHPFRWWSCNVLFVHSGDIIVYYNCVQCPALVRSCYFLPHGCHKALWVEEASHPEAVGSAFKHPATELCISLQQLSVPETNGRRIP